MIGFSEILKAVDCVSSTRKSMRGGIAPVSNLPSYSVSGVRGEKTIQALHSVAHPAGGVLVGCVGVGWLCGGVGRVGWFQPDVPTDGRAGRGHTAWPFQNIIIHDTLHFPKRRATLRSRSRPRLCLCFPRERNSEMPAVNSYSGRLGSTPYCLDVYQRRRRCLVRVIPHTSTRHILAISDRYCLLVPRKAGAYLILLKRT